MYDVSESMLTATWWALVRKMCRVLSPETSAVSGITMKVTGCKYPTQADCFKKQTAAPSIISHINKKY